MGDAEVRIGSDQRFIQHLLLLVAHIGDQQAEEGHELLNFSSQHGAHLHIIDLVNQLHLRRHGMPYLHYVDAVGGTRCNLDKLAADLIAGSAEFVSLDGRQNVALNAAHPHPKRQKLHGEGLACARCAQQVQVGIFIDLCVEQIHDAQGVVVSVDAQQHAIVVRQLKAGEDIAGCGAAGQHIALRLFLQLGRDFQERHHRLQCGLLLKAALAGVHIHGFEHIHHLLLAPKQFLVGFGRYGDENAHVKEVLVVVGDAILDKIARLYGISQLLIIGAGILHALELGAVEPDPLGDLIYGAAAVLTAEMDVDIHAFSGVDERGHPAGPDAAWIPACLDVEEGIVQPVHNDIVIMAQVDAAGRQKVGHADRRHRVHADDFLLCRHGVHHDAIYTGGKRLVRAGAPVVKHV